MCTLHEVIETQQGVKVYPYRCSRCKQCFLCQHQLEGYDYWICQDGYKKPTTMDPGVKV